MILFLNYLKEFACYGIKKSVITDCAQNGTVPKVTIDKKDIQKIIPNYRSVAKIGFILGEDTSSNGTEYYTIGNDYLKSLLKAGADLRFLDYDNINSQIAECQGLVLPGGFFSFPQNFYLQPPKKIPQKRYFAYEKAFKFIDKHNMPTLAICAGAQIIGALSGLKLYHSVTDESLKQKPHHLPDDKAHQVCIKEGSFLHKIMKTDIPEIWVNSRHYEAVIEQDLSGYDKKPQVDIYALSKEDGIPEAWGNENKNILCIQWHPENLAARGQQSMQNIYDWLVQTAFLGK